MAYWDAPRVQRARAAPPGPDLSNRVFGVVSAKTDAPMKNIMGNGYGTTVRRESAMPAGSSHERKVAAPRRAGRGGAVESSATIASALRTAATKERIRAAEQQGPGWKIGRFARQAQGKLERTSRNPAAHNPAYAEMLRRRAELAAATKAGGMRMADKVRARGGAARAHPEPAAAAESVPAMDFSDMPTEGQ